MDSRETIIEVSITNQKTHRTMTVEVNGTKAAARYVNHMRRSGYQVKTRVLSV